MSSNDAGATLMGAPDGAPAEGNTVMDQPLPAVEPDLNIICFRYAPEGVPASAMDALQEKVRARLLAEGSFYIVQTKLRTGVHLRTTLINPATTERDLEALIEAIRR